MSTTPPTMSAVASPGEGGAERIARRPPRFDGVVRFGFGIVAVVALIMGMNTTARFVVTLPVAEWFLLFLEEVAANVFIGAVILLAGVWARHRYPVHGRARYVGAFLAVTFATALAILAALLWGTEGTLDIGRLGLGKVLAYFAIYMVQNAVVALVITAAWLYTRTEAEHAAAIAQCAIDSARMDEQTAEARLQMLEAQIEPHFLFNTLAHVKRLYETDPEGGVWMLANLKAYLAVALPQMRATDSTLGRELDHVKAYLEIQQIRMGRRLAFAIDVEEPLRSARLPPLMLLTLVENAIKHGVAPQPGGGRVDIRASVDAGRLRVAVADTGAGFTKSAGGGTGLANIRARLAAQFGRDGSLALALNSPGGVEATIGLPYLRAQASGR
jgi:signal transduction histidine kinase